MLVDPALQLADRHQEAAAHSDQPELRHHVSLEAVNAHGKSVGCLAALQEERGRSLRRVSLIAIRHGSEAVARPSAYVLLTLFPLVITWICDTAAMAVGGAVGGTKLAPVLSPKKTQAGAVGGTLGGVITALALGKFVLNQQGWSFSSAQLLLFGLAA